MAVYMKLRPKLYTFLMLLLSYAFVSAEETISVANFSENNLNGWETQSFKNETLYTIVDINNQTALKAVSNNSASGLVKKIRIDIHKTPYINWQWKINQSMYRLAEDLKQGDDFAARVYVIIDGGVFFWRTLALNYVWASGKPINSLWDNPFTSNAKMLAVQSGDSKSKQWVTQKHNVRKDLNKAFGRDFRFIDAVAIMTDSDNSGQKAEAFYGDIYFSSQ